MNKARAAGFTLIELLVTVVIVGLLASVAAPIVELTIQRGKEKELRENLREIRAALDAYKQAADEGRLGVDRLASGYPPNLQALVEGVVDIRSPVKDRRIYFLRRLPRDPFAENGVPADASWGKRSYSSPPDMPAEGEDVFDVYSLSPESGLNGIPYRQW
ncbi:MAG: type II secretion system protein [Rhodocyclales bacterium]|nr:type II secretion system protein [Rhodocyclales bacterium]